LSLPGWKSPSNGPSLPVQGQSGSPAILDQLEAELDIDYQGTSRWWIPGCWDGFGGPAGWLPPSEPDHAGITALANNRGFTQSQYRQVAQRATGRAGFVFLGQPDPVCTGLADGEMAGTAGFFGAISAYTGYRRAVLKNMQKLPASPLQRRRA